MDSEPVRDDEAKGGKHEELLREIREDFSYFKDYWRDNHNEAKTDLRFVAGDPWDPADRRAREDNNRPVLCPDELGQYQNATINNLRQNKRAIKVSPKGSGAGDKDASDRSAIIRGIEYKSNAQSAYTNSFENQINCGFGFFRVTTKIISKDGEVEPRIKGIENPLSVLLDPNAKEPDFSDQKRCFVLDVIRKSDFKRKYPKAQKTSFTTDDMAVASNWFAGENIVIAEYWRIDDYDENGDGGKATQYITNGIEILETNPWPGSWIPIIAVMGKKVYVPVGGEMKRMYFSQIRLARGPQMMLAYIASQEAEEYGMAPRAPMIGYVGQFETDKEAWDSLNRVPRSYIQVDPVVDQAGTSVLPIPGRMPFSPNAQAYEIGFERWRRSVQAAMGISPLPTAAQRQSEKSGVALDKIQAQQAVGAFHFTDNFDLALENCGRQLNELITLVMDTPRHTGIRNPDDTHSMMHIVPKGQQPLPSEDGKPVSPEDVFDPTKGEFDVTISTGMSSDSQRDEGSKFADMIVGELANIPIDPHAKSKLLAMAIRLKNIGPIGDEMSDIIDPQGDDKPLPPQVQQAMQQGQENIQKLNAACQHYEQQIQELEFEKKAKVVDHQYKMAELDKELLVKTAIAEIQTKAQSASERQAFIHEVALQVMDMSHDRAMQAQGAQHAQDAQAQQAGHQQDLQAQQADAQSQQIDQQAQVSQQPADPAQG